MRLKFAKIFWFQILVIFFGLGHFSEALNYSNSIDFYNESSELISKKGSGGKKGGGKKGGAKKKGDKKTQTNLNKVQSNNEAMRDETNGFVFLHIPFCHLLTEHQASESHL